MYPLLYVLSFSLGILGFSFLQSQKVIKESLTPKLVFSFSLLNFAYLVLLFFSLVEELFDIIIVWEHKFHLPHDLGKDRIIIVTCYSSIRLLLTTFKSRIKANIVFKMFSYGVFGVYDILFELQNERL